MDNYMTLREAARTLGVLPDTLRMQIHRGKLTARKVGRDWFVTRTEIARYRSENRRK